MTAREKDPILLVKKLIGVLLLLLGFLLLSMAFRNESTAYTLLGIVALIAGALLLALQIQRRNQGVGQP